METLKEFIDNETGLVVFGLVWLVVIQGPKIISMIVGRISKVKKDSDTKDTEMQASLEKTKEKLESEIDKKFDKAEADLTKKYDTVRDMLKDVFRKIDKNSDDISDSKVSIADLKALVYKEFDRRGRNDKD